MKSYVARSSQVAARMMGGETIIMLVPDSTLFTLNEVASVIWNAADGKTPLEEIVADRICAEFDVALEIALEDADRMVKELARHGLLLVSEEPITSLHTSAQVAQ